MGVDSQQIPQVQILALPLISGETLSKISYSCLSFLKRYLRMQIPLPAEFG